MSKLKIRVWHNSLNCYVQPHSLLFINFDGIIDAPDHYTVELFTGKKDVNGKEIFASDIVKCYDGNLRCVEWCDDSASFKARHLPDAEYIDPLHLDDGVMKVVGNLAEWY